MPEKRQRQGESIPRDVIEAILSRLPVKSLVRFKLVSKSWKAIISDPLFSKINYNHLPKSHNLFLRGTFEEELFSLVRLEGASNFQKEADLGAPFGDAVPLCFCNGIVLLVPWNKPKPSGECVLWNPRIGRYSMISIPLPDMSWLNAGLYHDSRTDDYKIVIVSEKGNMVYSCKTRTWVEEELIPRSESARDGVFIDGCLYWPKEPHNLLCREILCFDFRERKTEELKIPDHLHGQFRLTKLRGRLCLDPLHTEGKVWGRENDGFRDLTDMVKTGIQLFEGRKVVLISCQKITSFRYSSSFIRYNDSEEIFEKVYLPDVCCSELVPYSESLLFPF